MVRKVDQISRLQRQADTFTTVASFIKFTGPGRVGVARHMLSREGQRFGKRRGHFHVGGGGGGICDLRGLGDMALWELYRVEKGNVALAFLCVRSK